MRYYCKNCGSDFRPAPYLEAYFQDNTVDYCPICLKEGKDIYNIIPYFETPEQYEARTEEPWPDNAPVFVFCKCTALYFVTDYKRAKAAIEKHGLNEYPLIFCAQGPEAPPDDWRPE
jgi:hypothetical protein